MNNRGRTSAPALPYKIDDALVVKCSRWTRGGRHLFFKSAVIQQPARARACGSGPKYRRPVDPPPIVQMRIYEGETWDACRDITSEFDADFVLYCSLEHARSKLKERVPATDPILTGQCVVSMAHLDRPEPAGYFLFSDLSVRHEGHYRLVFNLYEKNKNADDLDIDAPPPEPDPDMELDSQYGVEFFTHLQVIRSKPFQCFSAKKFPGLAESTILSRICQEQGLKVRIRRDVRMRKRDAKGNLLDEYAAQEEAYPPHPNAGRSPSPPLDSLHTQAQIQTGPYPHRATNHNQPLHPGHHRQDSYNNGPLRTVAFLPRPPSHGQMQLDHPDYQQQQQYQQLGRRPSTPMSAPVSPAAAYPLYRPSYGDSAVPTAYVLPLPEVDRRPSYHFAPALPAMPVFPSLQTIPSFFPGRLPTAVDTAQVRQQQPTPNTNASVSPDSNCSGLVPQDWSSSSSSYASCVGRNAVGAGPFRGVCQEAAEMATTSSPFGCDLKYYRANGQPDSKHVSFYVGADQYNPMDPALRDPPNMGAALDAARHMYRGREDDGGDHKRRRVEYSAPTGSGRYA